MTPQQAISALDRQLAAHGSAVTLIRKQPGGPDISLTVRGFLRELKPSEITDGIGQGARKLILSPSSLIGSPFDSEPPRKGDTAVSSGRRFAAQASEMVLLADVAVRFNLTVAG